MVKLTDEQITKKLIEEYKTKKLAEEEKDKIEVFNKAKSEAFKELSVKHDEEKQSLGVVWQGYEDADYSIPK